MLKVISFTSILCLLGALLPGCGGGSSGSGVYSSGIDVNRKVLTITSSEYANLCSDLEAEMINSFEQNKVGFCTFGGLFAASLDFGGDTGQSSPQDVCEDTLNSCLDAPIEQGDQSDVTEQCFIRQEGIPGCEASIAQLDSCLITTFDSIGSALNNLSCDQATTSESIEETLATAFSALSSVAPSSDCNAIIAACPNLLATNQE